MALTVLSKPSGIQPVGGGSLIYSFSEASLVGKTNYRVKLTFSTFSGEWNFRPNASLIINCDIAPILRSNLALAIATTSRMKSAYVTYQAIWNEGSDAAVNLSSDIIYYYVGNNHTLNKRIAPYQLVVDQGYNNVLGPKNMTIRKNYMNYFEFITSNQGGVTSQMIIIKDPSGGNKPHTIFEFDASQNKIQSFQYRRWVGSTVIQRIVPTYAVVPFGVNPSESNMYKIYAGSPDMGSGLVQRFDWAGGANTKGSLKLFFHRTGGPTYDIDVVIYGASAGPVPNLADEKCRKTINLTNIGGIGHNTDFDGYVLVDLWNSFFNFVNGTTYFISIQTAGGNASNYFKLAWTSPKTGNHEVMIYDGVNWNGQNKSFVGSFLPDVHPDSGTFNTLYNLTYDTCADNLNQLIQQIPNSVYLRWINDYGGISTYLFQYGQLQKVVPSTLGRYFIKTVFADRPLDLTTYNLLNELNRSGIEYNDNYKTGQYVDDIGVDPPLAIPVVINENDLTTETRRLDHSFVLDVRYPFIPNTEVS